MLEFCVLKNKVTDLLLQVIGSFWCSSCYGETYGSDNYGVEEIKMRETLES